MKFFSRKKTREVSPNIRDNSLRVQRDQDVNIQEFSSTYKHIIQESMDLTVAPLLSRDNFDASEQVILSGTENTAEQSILHNNTLLQSRPPSYDGSFQNQDETVKQPDTTTLFNQRRKNELLLLVKGFSFIGFFKIVHALYGWDFLSSVLLLLVGFAGGYLYLLISNIIKSTSETLNQSAASNGAEIALRAYRETVESSVSLSPCFEAAQEAYRPCFVDNNFNIAPLNTEEMRQRICDAFAKAVSNEITRVNNRRQDRNNI